MNTRKRSGRIARGFTNEVGQWEVAKDGDNRVLYQRAKNDGATFNVALVEWTSLKDIDLSVKLKAVAGEVDRGGGLVWRSKDSKNYYLARYNRWKTTFAFTRSKTENAPSSSRRGFPATTSGTPSV